ncbi:MAG TPA: hypothetical protein PK986_11275 [Spirochaetota bacterium]|nr:hypothetical protein [Spirochaetota bacterium]
MKCKVEFLLLWGRKKYALIRPLATHSQDEVDAGQSQDVTIGPAFSHFDDLIREKG